MTAASPDRPLIDRAHILRASASLGVLGTGADSLAHLMAALCDPQISGKHIAALVEKQPTLCARVLRVANSSYYGQLRSVTTIGRAVSLLGLDAVRGVAAAACVDRTMMRRQAGASVDMSELLNHSLAAGIAAESLARINHAALASEAFIAGLLHDLGVAVQVYVDPAGVDAMVDARLADAARGIRMLESELSSVGHEECIAVIFEAWQLPDSLLAAVAHHHLPAGTAPAHRTLATLVHTGATLSLACGFTFSLEPAAVELEMDALRELGLTQDDLDRVIGALPEQVARLRGAMAD